VDAIGGCLGADAEEEGLCDWPGVLAFPELLLMI